LLVLIARASQLTNLVKQGIVQDYPPLCEARGVMTAQFVGFLFTATTGLDVTI
jgi:hypothetical protein